MSLSISVLAFRGINGALAFEGNAVGNPGQENKKNDSQTEQRPRNPFHNILQIPMGTPYQELIMLPAQSDY